MSWLRKNYGGAALNFGRWWGNAANAHRRTGERSSEEIDAVGSRRKRITIVGEAKWTSKVLTPAIVADLRTYKIPALAESDFNVADNPTIVLFSKSGYSNDLVEMAAFDPTIELVDVVSALANHK
jgi:hypothetical protein